MTRFLTVLTLLAGLPGAGQEAARPPNVVVILADDLGFGDVACFNPARGKIPTPNIDRIAREGMRFTDAHSSSGVCSPSRYALLTGRYHWRTRLQAGIVPVFGKPLIAPDRLTLAGLLRSRGYHAACIGKWHLGWDWPIEPEQAELFHRKPARAGAGPTPEQTDLWREVFSRPAAGGPCTRGFDAYFGTDVPNWPPYCFIENDRTLGVPSEFLPAEKLKNNQASLQGPALPGWTLEPILPALADRACDTIGRRAKSGAPFLLYLPLTSPHTPLAVNEAWKGKSGLNVYADFVMETDAAVGRVLDALDRHGARENTVVVFTSDNGCAPYAGAKELEAKGHFPSGPFRGYKSDAWEGGHRVPFIVRWPGVVKPGTECGRLAGQLDLLATFTEALGVTLPPEAGEDSVSLLPLLKGGEAPVRESLVHHSARGLFAIRKGPWKLIFGPGSGGWSPGSDDLPGQLYNLMDDPAESRNLHGERPEVVAELSALMERTVGQGRSTPGPGQKNDVPVNWKKKVPPAKEP